MSEQDLKPDTILITMDGSPAAKAAANTSLEIAKSHGMKVRGVYVVDETLVLDTYADYAAELGRKVQAESRAELARWFDEHGNQALEWVCDRSAAEGVPCTTEVLFGGVPELILKEASQASLVSLGRRGNGNPSDPDHLGRNFKAVAHHCHQAMLVGGDEQPPMQSLLLAYDGSERAQLALEWASRLQRDLATQAIVFSAQDEGDVSEQDLSELRAQIHDAGVVDFQYISEEGQPAEEIVKVAYENHVGLIVMGGYRHTALLEWLVGSTVDRVLRSTSLPVLVA
jgi:nucleotide-binding universal stress UspA family protein